MDVQEFLTLSFEFFAIVPLALMIVDFVLNKNDSLAIGSHDLSENETDTIENGLQPSDDNGSSDSALVNVTNADSVQTQTEQEVQPDSNLPVDEVLVEDWRKTDALQQLSIRELKKLASEKKIKSYSVMVKSQLVEALLVP